MLGSTYSFPGAGWCSTMYFSLLCTDGEDQSFCRQWKTWQCCVAYQLLSQHWRHSHQQTGSPWWRQSWPWFLLKASLGWTAYHQFGIWSWFRCHQSALQRTWGLNSDRAKTQPCLTPLVTGNASDVSLLSWTRACMPLWNCRTMEMNFRGHPYLAMIFLSPSPTNSNQRPWPGDIHVGENRSEFCSWHFSCRCLAANTMSMVPRSFRNPHWLSGRSPWSRCVVRRLSRILAKICLGGCLRPDDFPFRLYRWMIEASWTPGGSSPAATWARIAVPPSL